MGLIANDKIKQRFYQKVQFEGFYSSSLSDLVSSSEMQECT